MTSLNHNRKITNIYQRIIALVSDLHVGSIYGLFPENYVMRDGNTIGLNEGQKKILGYFKDFVKTCKDFKTDTVFIVGDIISGVNWKELGRAMLPCDMDEQIKACAELLKLFGKEVKLCVWGGTPYHNSRELSAEEKLVDTLKKDGYNSQYMGQVTVCRLISEPKERLAFVAHEASSSMMYPETSMGRDIMFFLEGRALEKLPKIDIVIRGHRHSWCHIHKSDIHYIQLPCWEAFTPYKNAIINYAKFQPDIGGAIMFLDDAARCRVFHYLYPNVHISDKTKDV